MGVLSPHQVNARFSQFKKKERNVTSKCDFIYWLIDILGNPDNIKMILHTSNRNATVDYVKRKGQLSTFAGTNTNHGVVFVGNTQSGGHFHSMVKGGIQDSYKLGYQIRGSHNFCQLFSIMIYLSTKNPDKYKFDFIPGKYAHNITVAMAFLKSTLRKYKRIRDKIVGDIRSFQSRDYPGDQTWIFLVEEPRPVQDMTVNQLYEFIDNVSAHAQHFTNC